MSFASAWLDLVVGLDIHLEIVPMVPSPVPFPHPHCSVIWDPAGYVVGELIGVAIAYATGGPIEPAGPVLHGGRMATVTGDSARMPMKHIMIPPGATFALGITPSDADLLIGSKTVLYRGSSAVRVGDPAFTCSEPIRLPTGSVLPLGCPTVIAGGPPALDFGSVIGKIAPAALRNKWTAGKLHKLAAKVIPEKLSRLRRLAHKSVCFFTGHPVNVTTGGVMTSKVDFELPGPIPLRLERDYDTNWFDRDGPLGHGWSHSLDGRLWLEEGRVVVLAEDGRELEFNTRDFHEGVMRQGDVFWHPAHRMTLKSLGQHRWELTGPDGLTRAFGPVPGERASDKDRGMARLSAIRSRDGHAIKLSYDDRARLAEIVDTGGRTIGFEHDGEGRLRRVWLPASDGGGLRQHVEYRYDSAGDLVEVKDAVGKSWRFEYDEHLLVRETDRNGLSFYFQYDGYGRYARCIRTWGDDAIYDHLIAYDREGRKTIVTNSLGEVTTYKSDAQGMVTEILRPTGATLGFEYDITMRLLAETDELGHTARYTYDERGNRTMIVAPDKGVTKIRYDEHDQIVAIVTPGGGEHAWRHDRSGRVVAYTDPIGRATRYEHEGGDLVAIVDAGGATTRLQWSRARDLVQATAPDGAITKWSHDALGRVVERTDPKGNVQRRQWDALGRLGRVAEPDGNVRELAWDPEGNLVHARDRRVHVAMTYRGMGKLATRTIGGATTRFDYDTEEQLVAVTNAAGYTHRFERDAAGDVVAEIAFDDLRRQYLRDAAGRCTAVIRPGVHCDSTFSYDAAGRTIRVEHRDNGKPSGFEAYAYDADGQLVAAENDAAAIELVRDAVGRVIEEHCTVAGVTHVVESKHDHRDDRIGVRSSLGADLTIHRSVMGDVERLSQHGAGAKPWEARFVRDVLGREVDRQLPGGARSYWWRDALGRPTQHWVGVDQKLARGRSYAWDAGDRLAAITEEGAGTSTFSHDDRGALTKVEHADGRVELRCPDDVGNLFASLDGSDREYGRAGQIVKRRTEAGIVAYHFDAEGNLARKDEPDGRAWAYHFDAAGRLAQVDRPDGTAVVMRYDALGRRVSKSHGGVKARFLWDGDVVLHQWHEREDTVAWRELSTEEKARAAWLARTKATLPALFPADWEARWTAILADDGEYGRLHAEWRDREAHGEPQPPEAVDEAVITWLHEPEGFAPLARLSAGSAHSIVADHLGAPLCVLDEEGNAVTQLTHDTYGHASITGDAELCPHRFPGQWHDSETGLHYNRFRHYDPETGQYLSRDPLGLRGGLSPHAYVKDPTTWTDPLGLAGKPAAGSGCGDGGAASVTNAERLKKQLASEQQMSEIAAGGVGTPIAGAGARVPVRDSSRLAAQYGGDPGDWQKIRSSNYKADDGTSFEIHAYRNANTGEVVEPKTKFQ